MKNAFKFGFLALAISLTVAACGGSDRTSNSTDSTAIDSSVTTVDTTALDSSTVDTAVTDSTTAPVQ